MATQGGEGLTPASKAALRSQAMIGYAKAGLSSNEALRQLRAQGLGVARSRGLQMYGQLRAAVDDLPRQATLNLNRRPRRDEMSVLETKKASGYIQFIDVYVFDRTSGMVEIRPWSIRPTSLMTRQDVIDEGLGRFAASNTPHDDVVLGAVYMGTYIQQPQGVSIPEDEE